MNEMRFEIKNMGLHFYIPIIVYLTLLMALWVLPIENFEVQLFISLQVLFIPFSAWWVIFLVYELYHHDSEEILIQIYSNKLLINYARCVVMFLVMALVLLVSLSIKSSMLNTGELIVLLTSQVISISSFALFIAIFFKSVETSLMVIIMYVATELLTVGDLFPWPHIFYFNLDFTFKELVMNGFVSLIVSVVLLVLSYFFVRTIERNII